jgi:hypothetical protein
MATMQAESGEGDEGSDEGAVSSTVKVEGGWRCIKVEGPLVFELIGILSGLSSLLADAGVRCGDRERGGEREKQRDRGGGGTEGEREIRRQEEKDSQRERKREKEREKALRLVLQGPCITTQISLLYNRHPSCHTH